MRIGKYNVEKFPNNPCYFSIFTPTCLLAIKRIVSQTLGKRLGAIISWLIIVRTPIARMKGFARLQIYPQILLIL
jgi:hypothetical protein